MATVYLARLAGEAGFNRLYAVKVMHAHLSEEPAFVSMLLDEARIAARLHHPNVVPVVTGGVIAPPPGVPRTAGVVVVGVAPGVSVGSVGCLNFFGGSGCMGHILARQDHQTNK